MSVGPDVFVLRRGDAVVDAGTLLDLAVEHNWTKREMETLMRPGRTGTRLVRCSPWLRGSGPTYERDMACWSFRSRGWSTARIAERMCMTARMVESALARVDGGRYG